MSIHIRIDPDVRAQSLCGRQGREIPIVALLGAWGRRPEYREQLCQACLNKVEGRS